MQEDKYNSIPDLVKKGPIGVSKIYGEIRAGRLKAAKLGRRTLIRDSWWAEYLNNLPAYSDETKARSPNTRAAGERV